MAKDKELDKLIQGIQLESVGHTESQYNAWLAIQAEYLEEEGDDDDW